MCDFFFRVRVALTEDGVPMSTLREIALLKQLDAFKHPNIVKLVILFFLVAFDTCYLFTFKKNNTFFYIRLLDVCHGQLERERQLVLFLVFEHLEEDLAGYLSRIGDRGVPPKTIQVI